MSAGTSVPSNGGPDGKPQAGSRQRPRAVARARTACRSTGAKDLVGQYAAADGEVGPQADVEGAERDVLLGEHDEGPAMLNRMAVHQYGTDGTGHRQTCSCVARRCNPPPRTSSAGAPAGLPTSRFAWRSAARSKAPARPTPGRAEPGPARVLDQREHARRDDGETHGAPRIARACRVEGGPAGLGRRRTGRRRCARSAASRPVTTADRRRRSRRRGPPSQPGPGARRGAAWHTEAGVPARRGRRSRERSPRSRPSRPFPCARRRPRPR